MRLRTVSPGGLGWTRRRAGKGFVYLDEDGNRLSEEDAQRVRDLVIPPAWKEVWICPAANGHIQAVGVDDAGRRQYLYHPVWREKRDAMKFDRVREVSGRLPKVRERILEHLSLEGMPEERAAATAVRLLDLGYFRIGSDAYADAHGSFGLTTLERRHVRKVKGAVVFQFQGKSGQEHVIEIDDEPTVAAVETMRRRRGGGDRLMAYRVGRRWRPLDSSQVNDYLRRTTGAEITAKDFRTWHATVLAAAALAASEETGDTKASRKRAVVAAMKEVAEYLGNTPAIARGSYVDPRVIDLYEDGVTIEAAVRRKYRNVDERQRGIERAVRRMLKD